jgi:hypothetical protein
MQPIFLKMSWTLKMTFTVRLPILASNCIQIAVMNDDEKKAAYIVIAMR